VDVTNVKQKKKIDFTIIYQNVFCYKLKRKNITLILKQ